MKGDKNYLKAMEVIDLLYRGIEDKSKERELHDEFIQHIKKAAYSGHGQAQFELGQQFEDINFFGTNPNYSPKRSFYWYKKACENNIGDACNSLATHFESGIACKMDKVKALHLYKKAADLRCKIAKANYRLMKKELRH